jgi:hypothetical protein
MTITVKDSAGVDQVVNTLPNPGQAVSAASSPVVIASDQSTIPVSGPVTDAQLRATALPLPVGAATADKQDSAITSIANIDDKIPALVTGRLPIDGSGVTQPVSVSALPLPAGAATSAKQDTQEATLATLALESGGNLAAILAKLIAAPSTAANQALILAAIQAGLSAGEAHIGSVSGQSTVVSASYTRPANTDYYTALYAFADSISAPSLLTFTNIARVNGGSGYIVKARLVTDQSSNAARWRLHLFHTAPTAVNDNSAFPLLFANRVNKIGYIDFDAMGTEGSGSNCAESTNFSARLKFVCAAGSRNIYGILQVRDNFTPISGQNIYAELSAEVD